VSLETQLSLHHDLKDKRKNTTQAVNINFFHLNVIFYQQEKMGTISGV